MRTVEEFGRTVEEAREKAFRALGVAEGDEGVVVEVLDEGSPGNDLGWGRKFARIKVTVRGEAPVAAPAPVVAEVETDEGDVDEGDLDEEDVDEEDLENEAPPHRPSSRGSRAADKPVAPPRPSARGSRASEKPTAPKSSARGSRPPAEKPAPVRSEGRSGGERKGRRRPEVLEVDDAARDLLEKLIDLMHLHVSVEEEEGADGQTVLNMVGPDQGILIGKRGQTLEALQFVLNLILNKDSTERRRVLLDAGGYRLRREKALSDMAQRLARRALEERVQIALEPMNPAERRIIHLALADDPDVETFSEGEEPERKVIISPRR